MCDERKSFMTDTSAGLLSKSFTAEADWNHSGAENQRNLLVHELIAAQTATAPDALAVTQGKVSLTYRELDQRASELACLLRSLGVGPDVVVALYLNRSPGMIVAALAVLKAGGAYLPLDPSYPAERLEFILKDAQPSVLLTGERMLNTLTAQMDHVVIVDPEGRLATRQTFKPRVP